MISSQRNIHTNPEGVIGHARTDSSIYGSGNSGSPDVPTPPTGAATKTGAAVTEPAPPHQGTEAVVDDEPDTATANVNDPDFPNTAKVPATDTQKSQWPQ